MLYSDGHVLDVGVHATSTVATTGLELDEAVVAPLSTPGVLDDEVVDLLVDGRACSRNSGAAASVCVSRSVIARSGSSLIFGSSAAGSGG